MSGFTLAASNRRHQYEFGLAVFAQRHYCECLGIVRRLGRMAHRFRLARHPCWPSTCRPVPSVSAVCVTRGHNGASDNEAQSVTYVPGIKCNPCTRIVPNQCLTNRSTRACKSAASLCFCTPVSSNVGPRDEVRLDRWGGVNRGEPTASLVQAVILAARCRASRALTREGT